MHFGQSYALRLVLLRRLGFPEKRIFTWCSFSTTLHPGRGVEISFDDLRIKHPENMTIVLQHQFGDLNVGIEEFSITLFFAGKPSPMVIPFQSITSFNDPSVGFGLQFGKADEDCDDDERTMSDAGPDVILNKKL